MNPNQVGILVNQAVVSAMMAYLIQAIKKSKYFPWLTMESYKLNKIAAVVISGLTTIGVHMSFDHDTGVLTITGLTLATVGHGLWSWVQSFVFQQATYDGFIAPNRKLDRMAPPEPPPPAQQGAAAGK